MKKANKHKSDARLRLFIDLPGWLAEWVRKEAEKDNTSPATFISGLLAMAKIKHDGNEGIY